MNIQWLSLAVAEQQLSHSDYTQLVDNGSLTRRIRTACRGHFEVKLIDQRIVQPDETERVQLDLPDVAQVLSRRIFLCCDNQPKIFAKTIVGLVDKNKLLTDRINDLGTQSLGSILFRDPLAHKRVMHLAKLSLEHPFFENVKLTDITNHDTLWVRRSLYDYQGCDLIVYEAFLG